MQLTRISTAIALAFPGLALADMTVEDRLQRMERRIQYLEQRVQSQDQVIKEKEQKISELSGGDSGGPWFQNVEIGGVIEVEAGHHSPYEGDSTSDMVLATAEIGIAAQVNAWVAGEITLLYEEDDTDLEVDVATISVAPPDGPWVINAGQFYVPFGVFESNMVSDPLTLEIGETRETAAQAGFETGGAFGSLYVFNGSNKKNGDDRINNWGAHLGYGLESDSFTFSSAVSYINDIGDSDTLQDVLASNDVTDYTAGWSLSAMVETGPFTLIGDDEFDAGTLEFNGAGAKPSAWNIEAGYGFSIADRGAMFAIGYQGSSEALAIELPERRLLAALSVEIMDNTALSFEWAHDTDYDVADGGTGENADTLTAQLAVEF